MANPLPTLFLSPSLSSCFLGKSGRMRSSGQTKAFQSYNQTFISFPTWELVVAQVGTGTEDSWIRIPLFNQGGPIKSSKATWHKKHSYILCPSKNPFSLWMNLYFLFYLGTSSCPGGGGDWDRGLTDPCFSLQWRRPTKMSQGNESQETVLHLMSNSYNQHTIDGPTLLSLPS